VNLQNTLVLLDTCVLLRLRVADVIMDLRHERVFSAHWTENIDAEFIRNMSGVHGIPLEKAQRRLDAMKARCPEWEVAMTSADFEAVPRKVDPKDRHVAAAALALRHAADKDTENDDEPFDVILVTDNIKDLAKQPMKRLGVRVMRAGQFLDEAYKTQPEATTRAVLQAAEELKKPPYTVAELLYVLQAEGAAKLVAGLGKSLGIAPVAKAAF
jgi:hypothetical protein